MEAHTDTASTTRREPGVRNEGADAEEIEAGLVQIAQLRGAVWPPMDELYRDRLLALVANGLRGG